MKISVIVPVLNEEKTIAATLDRLRPLKPEEIIVVDGGSTDRTPDILNGADIKVIASPSGRAEQMNRGAAAATGDLLLFLHADTALPPTAMSDIRSAMQDHRCVGGRFDIELDGRRWMFRLIGSLISLRSRLTRVATGDQGIFVRRKVFETLGGFPRIPLMEDIAFSLMLKRYGQVACLRSRVITSSRRWEKEGVWRTILRMWILRLLFRAGIPPLGLKRYYNDAR
ncbi:MAG: TIGR04283 family arsenosugar biosynthesis glycosyltransferase [Deltaproteobacteria bacterium]|nr:TIGR04283 family arsenosugar biosynthesis glycosyltransferase [Deltaproteobacteria bacterium]